MEAIQRTPAQVFEEKERLAERHSVKVQDSLPGTYFDRYTRLVADIFRTPMAAVTLIDEGRRWFKSSVGIDLHQTPLEEFFCFQTLKQDIVEISDTFEDGFFRYHPSVVDSPFVRSYMGVVLRCPRGQALGTLCFMDTAPRAFTQAQRSWLIAVGYLLSQSLSADDGLALLKTRLRSLPSSQFPW